jgi:general stress protein YciG
MSKESTSETRNDKGGIGKNDPKRTTEAPNSGQQSQGTSFRTDKGTQQQGGSDHKSGQQSQADSRADDDGMKQAGSNNVSKDPKRATESGNKGASSR